MLQWLTKSRLRTALAILPFGAAFVLSILMWAHVEASGLCAVFRMDFIGLTGLVMAVGSVVGVISTVVLARRADRRTAKEAELKLIQLQQQIRELETRLSGTITRMGIAEALAALQAAMQAIDLYHRFASKDEVIQTLNLPRDITPFRQAAAAIEARRPPGFAPKAYADLFDKAAQKADACARKMGNAMDDNLLPDDYERIGDAARRCVCREVKVVIDFMGGDIPDILRPYWESQKCAELR